MSNCNSHPDPGWNYSLSSAEHCRRLGITLAGRCRHWIGLSFKMVLVEDKRLDGDSGHGQCIQLGIFAMEGISD